MTHEQIDRMVRKANPVRDPNTLGPVDVPVLTTPLERRMEMQVDDRSTEVQTDRNRGRGPLIGIAVAASVIVVAGLVWITRDNTPVAEPAPNATPLPAARPIDPGAYYADTDGEEGTSLRGTFVIAGTGWDSLESGVVKWADDGYVSLMVTEVDDVSSPGCSTTSEPAGTSAEHLANQFAAGGFDTVEALAPVSAFGQNGFHLVVEVPAECISRERIVWNGPVWGERYYDQAGQMEEYWFLDVEGTPVLVEASWFPESTEDDIAELRAVVDTLVITP